VLLLSGFALGVMTVLAVIIARDFGHLTVGKGFLAVLFAGACFLVGNHLPDPLDDFARDIYTMVPALFWLLCRLAFAYRPKVLSPAGLAALYTFIAPAFANHLGVNQHYLAQWVFWLWTLPSYFEYVVIVLGLWTVVAHWSDDLVESSRTLRGAVLSIVGISVFLVVIPMNTGIVGMWLPYLSVAIVTLVCAFFLLQGRNGVLFGIQVSSPAELPATEASDSTEQPPQPEQQEQAQALQSLMAEGFYRTEHLTLKALANALDLPEYKTRALINQTLGYRNFNDYINQLRIEDAKHRLTQDLDTPVLNVSLDVGYRTLSSFNRAFKDITGLSPTEFRQKNGS